jgi:transaldolase
MRKAFKGRSMTMSDGGILERLQEANPDAEIWWDSSPLVYRNWSAGIVEKAPSEKRDLWRSQLNRLFDPDNPGETLFRGVTTNPPLSHNAIKDDPKTWAEIVKGLIQENPDNGVEEIFWMTYKQIVKRGAEYFMPVWERSEHTYGYLSGQVDPRDVYDLERMCSQALELAELSPNVMIKCPGSREGYELIEQLTARGIATNNTLAFTVPQFCACMEAVQRGLAKARENKVDMYRWRSVITHMSARYGTLGDLKTQAEARGMDLNEADIRWAELAIFKRGYRILEEKGYPNKMLMCSMRISPSMDDGSAVSWHIEKIAGGDVIYTCPPKYIGELMEVEDKMRPFDPEAIWEEPPKEVLNRLMRLPYFVQAYEPDGMTKDQFNKQAALVATAAEFSKATRATVDFVAQQFQAEGRM